MITSDVIQRICQIDPAFNSVALKFPNYPLIESTRRSENSFESLVLTIVSQQLSGKAATTITDRLRNLVPITPTTLLATDFAQLKSVGLSGAKAKSILALSEQVTAGLDLAELTIQHPDQIRNRLIQIWGVGNWTVDMFLMFDLRQPDIWPINDLGVQKGWQVLHELPERPTPTTLSQFGEPFLGIRSAVAWYCWRALEL